MLTCIITGSNDSSLIQCTLDLLMEFNVTNIIIATNVPCSTDICRKHGLNEIVFSEKCFSNGNEARNFALEHVFSGRILFLESGSMPTEKSLAIHSNAESSQVICGLYKKLYDFESNYRSGLDVSNPYKVNDIRLYVGDIKEAPWRLWRDNNISVDVSGIRRAGEFNSYLCVEGITENAEMGHALHNLDFDFIVSQEAQIEVYIQLADALLQPAKVDKLYIWFTDLCNYHCRMCRIGQRAYSAMRYSEPTIESIKELISTASKVGVTKVELFGGEMLMRKELFEVIEFCNLHGIETGFVSNGSLITLEVSERFSRLGIKDTPISVDAPFAELNDWIRGKDAWNRTMEGIKQMKKYNNTFSIYAVVLKQNFRYMSDLVRLAKELGAESISFQPVSSRQGGNHYSDFVLKYSDIPQLKKEILKAFETADQLNISIRSRSMVKTIPEYILRGEQLLLQRGCTLPLSDALITKTGKLQLCFTSYGSKELYKKSEWLSFLSVWESPSYQELRKLAVTGQCPGCLANCSDHRYLFTDSDMDKKIANLNSM